MDLRPPMTASGRAAVVATLVTGADGGGGRQRVQHSCVSVAEHGEYAEYRAAPPSQPSPQPRRHPQQIEVGVGVCGPSFFPSFALHHFDFDDDVDNIRPTDPNSF